MLRRFLLFLCLIVLTAAATAQGLRPYNPTPETNIGLITFGGSVTLGSMYLDRKVEPMSLEQIEALDFDKILGIDRYSTVYRQTAADQLRQSLLPDAGPARAR